MNDKKLKYLTLTSLILLILLFMYFVISNCDVINNFNKQIEIVENFGGQTQANEIVIQYYKLEISKNICSLVFNCIYILICIYFTITLFWVKLFNKTAAFLLILFFITTNIIKYALSFIFTMKYGYDIGAWLIIFPIFSTILITFINMTAIKYYKKHTKK